MSEQKTFPSDATQNFVEVEKVLDDTIVLKDGGLRAILMVSGVNFELKSEEEQNIIISAYQDFLNSLDFSIQIVVHSRKINIDNYIGKIKQIKEKEQSPLLKEQIEEYAKFIEDFVKNNEIMTKNFFVVVPYQSSGIKEVKKGISSAIPFFGGKKKKDDKKDESIDQQITQLQRRVDQVVAGLVKIGLRVVKLNREELTELLYDLYNQGSSKKKFSKTEEN